VNQREVNTHTRSFARALEAVSREDPDIVVIGQLKELDTINAALELAVSGRLVLGCLDSSTALGTIDGLVRRFPSDQHALIRAMLSETIICIVSQVLLKGKEEGLVPAFEVLTVTSAVCNMIRDGKNQQLATIMQTGKSQGMQTFNSHLVELVEKERVEADEALEKSSEKDSLKSALKGKGLLKEEET
jgi:twitching motility protein PilT